MKKENMLWMTQNSIFLIIFNVVFFVIGGIDHKASAWISYAFIHFAYFMLLYTPRLIRGEKNWTALGFPLYSVSATYFLVEFFVGVVFILISSDGYKAALLIQLCIAGFYGVMLISNMLANEHTMAAETVRQPQIAYVKNASAKLKGLLERIDDKEAMKKVERVYDAIYSSPVKSHPDLSQIENNILASIQTLEDAVSAGNKADIIALAKSLETAINERNRLLKTYN